MAQRPRVHRRDTCSHGLQHGLGSLSLPSGRALDLPPPLWCRSCTAVTGTPAASCSVSLHPWEEALSQPGLQRGQRQGWGKGLPPGEASCHQNRPHTWGNKCPCIPRAPVEACPPGLWESCETSCPGSPGMRPAAICAANCFGPKGREFSRLLGGPRGYSPRGP